MNVRHCTSHGSVPRIVRSLSEGPKRLAWFLQLQHILRFPRYSWAPPHALQRLRKPDCDGDTVDHTRAAYPADERRFAATVSAVAGGGSQGRGGLGRPTGSLRAPFGPPVALPAAISPIRQSQLRQAPWPPGSIIPPPGAGWANIVRSRKILATHKNAPGFRIAQRPSDGQGTKQQPFPNLATPASAHAMVAWGPPLRSTLPSIPSAPVDLSVRASPPPADERTEPDSPSGGERMRPGALESASAFEPGSRRASANSTVHIDGSAFGRWAIQHLERTLGKPASGMTGVDPRTNVPRSRVSPF